MSEKGYKVIRLAGKSRYETAELVAEEIISKYGVNEDKAYYVDGRNYPDALSVVPYVVKNNGIMLLNDNSQVTKGIAIGGENSVPSNVTRLSGSNRYATSAEIAAHTNSKRAIIVDGTNYSDALASSAVAVKMDADILLTDPKSLSSEIESIINNYERLAVVSGASDISEKVIDQIHMAGQPVESVENTLSGPKVLDLGVSHKSNKVATTSARLNQSVLKDKSIVSLKKLRGQMWDINPKYEGSTLREVAAGYGITSKDQYINIAWDSNLEKIAIQRVMENAAYLSDADFKLSHNRPDGSLANTDTINGVYITGEVLAYNQANTIERAIEEQWGTEQLDALNAANGYLNDKNGHLHIILNPKRTTFAFAGIDNFFIGVANSLPGDGVGTGLVGEYTIEYPTK